MTEKRWWWVLVGIAVAARWIQASAETAYIHPDALFQALEPAYRLVFGHGHQAWEFQAGVRNWAWPGLLAGAMKSVSLLGLTGPGWGTGPSVAAAALVTAVVDGAALVLWGRVAARWVAPGGRPAAAVAVVLAGSILPLTVVPGSQPIIGVPAGFALAWTCFEGLRTEGVRPLRLGLAAGLLTFIRVQLSPAALIVMGLAGWQNRKIAARIGVGFVVVALLFGGLDWISWGAPWSSMTGYLGFSFLRSDHVFGTMPGTRYGSAFFHASGFFGVALVGLALVAVRRAWPLWLVMASVLVPHHLVGQKQLHFLHPAMGLLIALAVIGTTVQLHALTNPVRRVIVAGLGLWLLASSVFGHRGDAYWDSTWLYHHGGPEAVARSRGLNAAYRAISEGPAPPRVVQAVLPQAAAPGHAWLGHDVPEVHLVSGEVAGAPIPGERVVAYRGPPPVPGAPVVWEDGRGTVIYRIP